MVKIGKWGADLDTLRKRYLTFYGPQLLLTTAAVDDMKTCEDTLHCVFSPFALGGELFDKKCWHAVCSVIDSM